MKKVKAFCIYFVSALIVMTIGAWVSALDVPSAYKMVTVYSIGCIVAYFLYVMSQEAQRELSGEAEEEEWN